MAAHDPKTKRNASFTRHMVVLVSVTLLSAAAGAVNMARNLALMGPAVGDIVAFDPALPGGAESGTRLIAARTDRTNCVLDIDAIRRSGGSLVLERRVTGPTRFYHAHWAGPRTSEPLTDCGSNADLVLTMADVSTLAVAAGGFGASPSPGPAFE